MTITTLYRGHTLTLDVKFLWHPTSGWSVTVEIVSVNDQPYTHREDEYGLVISPSSEQKEDPERVWSNDWKKIQAKAIRMAWDQVIRLDDDLRGYEEEV